MIVFIWGIFFFFFPPGSGAVVGDDYPGCTIIGSNNIIGYHAVVGVKCQDMKYKVCFKLIR